MNKQLEHAHNIIEENSWWRDDIENIAMELHLFAALLGQQMVEKSKSRIVDYSPFFESIETLSIANRQLGDLLAATSGKMEGIRECDDLQCEAHFINQHTSLKEKIESHFSCLRSFRKQVYAALAA